MKEKVTPKVDIAFKKLFGVEENKDLLMSLINSIVSEEDQVLDVHLLNPYNPKNFQNDKLSILDIKAKSHAGKYFNIEIQITDEIDYEKRALFYWSKLYTEQLNQGEGYTKLKKTIGIHILNFTSIPSEEKYHNIYNLLEKDSKLHHFKDLELHIIELSKFENSNKKNQNLSEIDELHLLLSKVKTSLDRWVAFLTRIDLLSNKRLPKELRDLKDPHVEKALGVLEVMNFSEDEREAYDAHLKWLRIEASALEKAEEKGEAKGIEIGQAKGIEIGRAKRDIEIVENMLSQGINITLIAKTTGLAPEQIEKLKKEDRQMIAETCCIS